MRLTIRLDSASPQVSGRLLEGLDYWVKLGLLSEAQIQEIALTMSEPLPIAYKQTGIEGSEGTERPDALEPDNAPHQAQASPAARSPNRIAQAAAALVEEISVIWLLFLGVFLVVVSSGVLAASQWDSFSAVGQYCVLFAYTLAFWAASLWARGQEKLRSTGRMLALTTMLLVPVNFWMMDRFGALGDLVGLAVCGVAAIALTLLPLSLSRELMPRRTNRINLIGLSWLHWGWSFAAWPAIATYIGAISTAANLVYQDRRSAPLAASPASDPASDTEALEATAVESSEDNLEGELEESLEGNPRAADSLPFDVLTVMLSGVILLTRSLLIAQVPPYQLGLAAGICGWLIVWLTRQKASRVVWERVGFGLLLAGWLATADREPPLQAITVSLLALTLVWTRLQQFWTRGYLLAILGIGLQTYALMWTVLPMALRDRLLRLLSTWFDVGNIEPIDWASIGFFPFLLCVLAFATYLRRQTRPQLARQTEQIAFGFGLFLALLSLGNSFTAAVNLTLSTVTLGWSLTHRRRWPNRLLTLTHVTGLAAAASWIFYVAPNLSGVTWGCIALGGAIAELLYHPYLRSQRLQRNTWGAGLVLSLVSYGLLLEGWSVSPPWIWLSVPVALTFVAHHPRSLRPQTAAKVATLAFLMQLPWLVSWRIAILSFAVATFCTGLNSRIWRSRWAAQFTVGFALLLTTSIVWRGLLVRMDESVGRLSIFHAIVIGSLWLLQRGLAQRTSRLTSQTSNESPPNLTEHYTKATRNWALALMLILLLWGTVIALLGVTTTSGFRFVGVGYVKYLLAALVLLAASLAERIYHRSANWQYYSLAWAVEIGVAIALVLQISPEAEITAKLRLLGISTLVLGFVAQIAGDFWTRRHPHHRSDWRSSWHALPIFYAAFGWWLGHNTFSAETGWFTVAAGLIFVGVGRRQRSLHLLSSLGLLALSAGAYELLIYRLLQSEGGQAGDGITLLAILALLLTALYRVAGRQLASYSKLPPRLITLATHGHWALAGGLCAIAPTAELSQPNGIALWTATTLLTASYALVVGNRRWTPQTFVADHTVWTKAGLLGVLLCVAYDRFVWFPDQAGLLVWGGAIACVIGLALRMLPWARFGWGDEVRSLGLWLPLLTLSITWLEIQTQGMLIVAAFYAWMANRTGRIRLSYLSVALFDLALLDYLGNQGWLSIVTFSLIVSLSILYVTEVDSYFRSGSKRQQKHWIRVLASGLVGISALYQTEISDPMLAFASVAVVIGILFIFAGLILKVRAFLYVGTATFILQILRVLWLFISANSLLLWAVGIVLGLTFIWVAATFESRRSQVISRLSAWTSALAAWD